MTVIATSSNLLSGTVKHEYEPNLGYCRDVLTVNDAASTFKVGTVLGAYLTGGAATAAITGTGNGSIGTVTVGAKARASVYTLRIVKAAANAGDFTVVNSDGRVVGTGTVGVAYNDGALSFTLADGATDFIVGDTIAITVTGALKYKKVESSATDGSDVARAVFIGDVRGEAYDLAVAATTDTTVLALTRGPVLLGKAGLFVGASVNDATKLAKVYADLKAVGLIAENSI